VDEQTARSLVDVLVATGLGVFIGLEREHSDVGPPAPVAADGRRARTDHIGVRTFALLSLFGWLCGALEPSVRGVPLVGLAMAGVLLGLQYVRTWETGAGMTTEAAALVTFALGLLVHHDRLLAVALALVVTFLLIAKPWVRSLVAHIERRELLAALQLAILLAIVLPLLPTEARDPWGVLGPRRLGLFVVLIAGISFVGYVLLRVLGPRRGAGLAGLLGGLASSTAVTAAMAERARASAEMVIPAQLATLLANAVMFGRVLVVSAALRSGLGARLAVPMGLMGAVMLAGALWRWRALGSQGQRGGAEIPLANPFALLPALKWGALLAFILVITAVMKERFGARGLFAAAAVTGFADVDAINVAVSREAASGALAAGLAVKAITIGAIANTITKGVIATTSGGRAYARPILITFAVAIAAGLLAAMLM
jgi:uncharacterized membrane protein (DUF4010 family)